jgi:hypothetical protein
MKKLAILILVALGMAALACGHSNLAEPAKTAANGFWEAQLIGGRGDASLLDFVSGFSVTNTNGGTSEPLTITSFGFFNLGSCFATQNENGSANLTTSTTNLVTGSMVYTITSVTPVGNTLTLIADTAHNGGVNGTANNGVLANGVANGEWTLATTNSNTPQCTGGGTFVMCQNAATCTVP